MPPKAAFPAETIGNIGDAAQFRIMATMRLFLGSAGGTPNAIYFFSGPLFLSILGAEKVTC
jgi:hypothetical protein